MIHLCSQGHYTKSGQGTEILAEQVTLNITDFIKNNNYGIYF
jgi:hypothetical protein